MITQIVNAAACFYATIRRITDEGEIIKKRTFYRANKSLCFTVSLRKLESGKRVGNITVSHSDIVESRNFNEEEIPELLAIFNHVWGGVKSQQSLLSPPGD
jgi:hypothetical protein